MIMYHKIFNWAVSCKTVYSIFIVSYFPEKLCYNLTKGVKLQYNVKSRSIALQR